MSNELQTIDFENKEMVATLKATVAQGLTDPEFRLFAELCKSSGLNPFQKEIWAIKAGGRLQLMTGINGFHSIANSNPQYDGIESGLITPAGEQMSLCYPKNDFIGAWCKVYRKDRRVPVEAVAMMSEYKKSGPTWQSMARVMITKCAESVALRKAFPQKLNGLYTQEEMPTSYQAPAVIQEPINITPQDLGEPDDWLICTRGSTKVGRLIGDLAHESLAWLQNCHAHESFRNKLDPADVKAIDAFFAKYPNLLPQAEEAA